MIDEQSIFRDAGAYKLEFKFLGLDNRLMHNVNFLGKTFNREMFFLRGVNFYLKEQTHEDPIFQTSVESQLLFILLKKQIGIISLFSHNKQLKKLFSLKIQNQKILLPYKNKLKFISTNKQYTIHICHYHSSKSWILNSKSLSQEHLDFFHLYQAEDFLVSGSQTGIIRFWQTKDWSCFQTIDLKLKLNGSARSSLNQLETQLIILYYRAKKIFVLEKKNATWMAIQEIKGDNIDSICFTTSNRFVTSTHTGMPQVYEWKEKKQMYQPVQKFQIQGRNERDMLFRVFYIQNQKQLFISRGSIVNVLCDKLQIALFIFILLIQMFRTVPFLFILLLI